MKKSMRGLSLVLVLVLVLTLSLPAMAAEEEAAEGPLTRGAFVEALFGLTGIEDMEPKQAYFDDVPMSGDLALAVRWAVGAGVVNGYGNGKFGPDDPITREQAATMIYRYAQSVGKGFQGAWMFLLDYPDAAEIAPWADEAMHYAVMNGIFTGSEEGLFPRRTLSAAELPVILEQIRTSVIGDDADKVLRNEGLSLFIPGADAALVIAEAPKDAEDGTLFTVSEKASVEAAEALGEEADGAGWLFAIRKVSADELQELLCSDMSGMTPFARDGAGDCYLFCTPTDVRLVRDGEYTDEDWAAWSSLRQWANGIPELFLADNLGLEPYSRGNSELEIYLNQILAGKLTNYTFSCLNPFDPLEPGETDPAPFIEKLLDAEIAFDYSGEGAPDGEYVVLNLPDEDVRIDFFFLEGKQNYIRMVADRGETTIENIYIAAFADEETTANGVAYAWYKAVAGDQGYAVAGDDQLLSVNGLNLTIPADKADLLIADTLAGSAYGDLFTVSEKASVEAAEAKGGEADGAGWLFAIRRVTEEELNELLCNDMSGVTPFAKDEDSYYLFCTPTDLRIDREGDITEEDQAAWGSLNDWAAGIPEAFMEENGLEPFTRGNSDLEIYLNRILCGLETYTVSTNEFGPLEPGDTDPAPFIEKLLDGVFSYTDAEAPDGEYVVLMFPNDSTRFDFFFAPDGQNLIRKVVTLEDYSSETMFQVAFEDETTANGIMSAWYDALAKDQGLK